MHKLTLEKWIDHSSLLHFIGGQITRDGRLLLIETDCPEIDFFQRPICPLNLTIRIIHGHNIETVELRNVRFLPTLIDLFTDGTILLVQNRCLKDGSYVERNARRYHSNGQLLDAFTIGDGIQDVQIDDTDTIWVSYFDEGIFGNFGWDEPMGSAGVVAYTKDGQPIWHADDYGIIDCYALNVVHSKEVYFFYYDDFNLVRLTDLQETTRYRVSGDTFEQFMCECTSFICQVDLTTVKRFRIKNRTITAEEKLKLVDKKGKRIIGHIFMRGSFLYVYNQEGIYRYQSQNN